MDLNTKLEKTGRIGLAVAKKIKRLGVETVYDLLFYFPSRYEDFSSATPIKDLLLGTSANVVGTIELIQSKRSPRRHMAITEALLSDETGSAKIVWFNQPFIARVLRAGDKISVSGKVDGDYSGIIFKSPNYEKIGSFQNVHTQGLVPIYPLTANLTQKQIRFVIRRIVSLADGIEEWLPEEILKRQKLLKINETVKKIHFPKNNQDIADARRRLAFNELFLIQLQSQLLRRQIIKKRSEKIIFYEAETREFVKSLPFELTAAQKKCAWEIIKNLEKEKPMTRLLEGDVGSGKTVVAVMAMLNTALNKKQAVLMVPTEILARQHFENVKKLLANTSIKIAIITRSQHELSWPREMTLSSRGKINIKKEAAEAIKNGETDIVIGTHALIQEAVEFKNLGLAIIDEQHRFGVEQRKTLTKKSGNIKTTPHLLSMTATPIPRSLALVLYGDLDISILDEMPKDRKKIMTRAVEEEKRPDAYRFIRREIDVGRQAFVICPLIDVSDKLGVKSVKEEYEKLDKKIFPDLKIGFLHGRMKAKEKEEIMKKFLENEIKILVSTSVVEVGVDVPNACVMMIEGAERFGLAQLHQFRGRVGRSEHQSYCFLFSENFSEKTKERLSALEKYHDGFTLAKIDLKFRGPGEVFGTSQKGFPEVKFASLSDHILIAETNKEAVMLVEKNPKLENYPILKEKIQEWDKKVHLE